MKQILLIVLISCAICTCQQKTDTRCSLNDNDCQKDFFQTVARRYAYTGIPDAGIPIIDPYKMENIKLSILGLLELTLVHGEAVGIGKCIVTKFESNVAERYRQPEMICDKIIVRGYYKLKSAPIIGHICGWCDIHGEGNGTIVLEDWFFKFKYNFKFEKRNDNQIYMKAFFDKAIYEASVKKVTVEADQIKSGKHDITHRVIEFINNNWKAIMDSEIGKFINDKSAEEYYKIYNQFYEKSPATTFLKDDLTPLVESK